MTIRLYLGTNTYALTVQALLEELALPHELRWVKIFQETPDPDLLRVSPHSRVPALEDGDLVIFETGAVALYLAETYGKGALLIPPGDPDRPHFLQWFHFLATTLQPDVMMQFHPESYAADAATQERLRQAAFVRLDKVFHTLDAALADGPWFFGDKLSILDFLLGMQGTWPEIYPDTIDAYPNIARHQRAMLERPSVRRTLQIHQAKMRENGEDLILAIDPAGW
ncbi:MAG: glutathione S-transferase family protein [Alphaproteobacteria bacterium]|jgi:glutathione S-transferase|nr:glutathione S-transferase family protein [Rhodospirillaceae bacterium]MBT6510231.1 glutathione S-transferase family protein [Rhodospirillaceae bacterium]MBT7614633.1 glutathione S-transferase family protein [Rhodospirillaceae bacterium]MBT7645435.1 glutathione S-transferase family protein [Rhodospirillaceae bacterium]MDG2481821.1 glutathione S-transferase family protein [Alphaproteobacteria bacterium]